MTHTYQHCGPHHRLKRGAVECIAAHGSQVYIHISMRILHECVLYIMYVYMTHKESCSWICCCSYMTGAYIYMCIAYSIHIHGTFITTNCCTLRHTTTHRQTLMKAGKKEAACIGSNALHDATHCNITTTHDKTQTRTDGSCQERGRAPWK